MLQWLHNLIQFASILFRSRQAANLHCAVLRMVFISHLWSPASSCNSNSDSCVWVEQVVGGGEGGGDLCLAILFWTPVGLDVGRAHQLLFIVWKAEHLARSYSSNKKGRDPPYWWQVHGRAQPPAPAQAEGKASVQGSMKPGPSGFGFSIPPECQWLARLCRPASAPSSHIHRS